MGIKNNFGVCMLSLEEVTFSKNEENFRKIKKMHLNCDPDDSDYSCSPDDSCSPDYSYCNPD